MYEEDPDDEVSQSTINMAIIVLLLFFIIVSAGYFGMHNACKAKYGPHTHNVEACVAEAVFYLFKGEEWRSEI